MSATGPAPIRPHLREAAPYAPVKPLDVLARELGYAVEDLVKLDANENPYGVLPAIREALAHADHHIYPDPAQTDLREAIGDYLGVDPDAVVAGVGSDELIDLLMRAIDTPSIVIAPPTFGMYEFLADINRLDTVRVPRGPAPNFDLDIDGIANAVAGGARLVFLASPNNPTGKTLLPAEVAALVELDAVIVVDEAYAEFSGHTAVGQVGDHPNLVVLRTFSKWSGLAGMRVGYAVAPLDLADVLHGIRQPYNVSTGAQAAALAAIEHRAELMEQVAMLRAERDRMAGELAALGWLTPCPSDGNFVLFEVHGRDAEQVAARLRERGVLVRYYHTPELRNFIRISAGTPGDTDRLLAALRAMEDNE